VRAVFFDAGGTLIHMDYARIARAIGAVLGRELEPAAFVAAEYAGRAAVEAAMAAGQLGTDSSRWAIHFRTMLAALGVSDEEFDRVSPAIRAQHAERHLWSVTAPGTADALAELVRRGWLVGCISNADGTVDRLLEATGLLEHLSFVVDSGKVGIEKPDRRIFAMALERAGTPADETYYVGDLYPVDVVGARSAGLVPVLLDPLGRYGGRDCRTARDVPSFCRELVSLEDAA
jgi:putative hydrolase of the HAD superfamily